MLAKKKHLAKTKNPTAQNFQTRSIILGTYDVDDFNLEQQARPFI